MIVTVPSTTTTNENAQDGFRTGGSASPVSVGPEEKQQSICMTHDTQPLLIDEDGSSMETQADDVQDVLDCFEEDEAAEKLMGEVADSMERAHAQVDSLPPKIKALLDRRLVGSGATPAAVLDGLADEDGAQPEKKRLKLERVPSMAVPKGEVMKPASPCVQTAPKHQKLDLSYGICVEEGTQIPVLYRDGREANWNGLRVSRGRFGLNITRRDFVALKAFLAKVDNGHY